MQLVRAMATRFDRELGSGRNHPCLLACSLEDGSEVEVVVKLRAGCERGVTALAIEAIAAMFAQDIDLPVPQALLVEIDSEFAQTIPVQRAREHALSSLGFNFGSRKVPSGFSTMPVGKPLPLSLLQLALEILAFDTFIVNPDRTKSNPNLLFNGKDLAIFDHELALMTHDIIGWKPAWEPHGVNLVSPRHVFLEQLRGTQMSLDRFMGAVEAITHARIEEYRDALPPEWLQGSSAVDNALAYLFSLTKNIGPATSNLMEALR